MSENIFAYTGPTDPGYPAYVSINRNEDGDVVVSVRGAPKEYEGSRVCAFAHQAGEPGRCTPGDEFCNNYCNMAPQKGPMQDHPLRCKHVKEGPYAQATIPAAEWARLMGDEA
jgi:hypothetical protein